MIRACELDRSITIQQRATTLDSFGQANETWTDVATVRARRRDTTGREYHSQGQQIAEQQTVFRIRWRSGLNTAMRISHDSRIYDIRSIAEMGRREALDIAAVAQGV